MGRYHIYKVYHNHKYIKVMRYIKFMKYIKIIFNIKSSEKSRLLPIFARTTNLATRFLRCLGDMITFMVDKVWLIKNFL